MSLLFECLSPSEFKKSFVKTLHLLHLFDSCVHQHMVSNSPHPHVGQTRGFGAGLRIVAIKRGVLSREGAGQTTKASWSGNEERRACGGAFVTDGVFFTKFKYSHIQFQ